MRNVFFFYNINSIGGVETFFWELAKKYHKKYDITVYYVTGDPKQISRLRQYVEVIQYKNQNGLVSDFDALHMLLLEYKTGDSTTVTVLRPENSSTQINGYQTTTYREVTLDLTFLDFNYSK